MNSFQNVHKLKKVFFKKDNPCKCLVHTEVKESNISERHLTFLRSGYFSVYSKNRKLLLSLMISYAMLGLLGMSVQLYWRRIRQLPHPSRWNLIEIWPNLLFNKLSQSYQKHWIDWANWITCISNDWMKF